MVRILVADDEPDVVGIIELAFRFNRPSYRVDDAYSGAEAMQMLRERGYDLLILDVSMPSPDGFEITRRLRERSNVPIILLTAKAMEADKVRGLELGADDYVTKPFSHKELIARADAVLRRASAQAGTTGLGRIVHKELEIDPGAQEVRREGELVNLTPTEYRLLFQLASNRGRVMTHKTLLAHVWGVGYHDELHYLKVYVRRLREKLERDPRAPRAHPHRERGRIHVPKGSIVLTAPRMVVLGSSNTDMVVRVERIPAVGETVLGGDLLRAGGGKGANQAVAAARLGARVSFIGAVGEDDLGSQTLERLGAEGIDVSRVARIEGVPSGVALILVDSEGRNLIAVAPGANARLAPDAVRCAGAVIAEAQVLLTQLEVPVETVLEGLRAARSAGVLTVLNPAPALEGLPEEVLRCVDVLTPNEREAAALVGRSAGPEELARELLARGVGSVVITLGAEGALVAESGRAELVPALRVRAVDTTAAGDTFSGGLVVALAEGLGLVEAARFASAAASLSVTRDGAQPSMPSRAEVELALRRAMG